MVDLEIDRIRARLASRPRPPAVPSSECFLRQRVCCGDAPRQALGSQQTLGRRFGSAGAQGGDHPVAAVGEAPAEGYRQRRGVAPAEVVGVWITFDEELVEPDLRAPVVVAQGHDGALGAPGPRALTERPWHGGEQ